MVRPEGGSGPGVLVLHSWWGLTTGVRRLCDRLADAGFSVVAPDLMEGRLPETAAEAEVELAELDPNATQALLLSSVVALRSVSADPSGAVSGLGFSMGGSWALWLAARQPDSVNAVVVYYGTTDVDFSDLSAPVLGHFAELDDLVSDDELVEMESHLRLLGKQVELHRYRGTRHFFAEEGSGSFDPAATAVAWERTVDFLSRR